ncbi:ComF family protein [Dethiobacter alkaliphilus]|uniref:ComF family protein n=1 Tax=Dethiobacter alkaliphilus TaxID=427926 RepID=UPI00222661F8|nr:ComF family protein [Dethiobacter alkaliphilus]MCW3488644.1 ComF family protein [Dethiobacter alkaliphilus]
MSLLTPLLDLLFPPRCIFCRSRNQLENAIGTVCDSCLEEVSDPQNCCRRCAYPPAGQAEGCSACGDRSFSFSAACSVSLYRGKLKKAIHKYKYKGGKDLAGPLGQLVSRQVRRSQWPALEAVVPVPLHPDKLLERGYDQALLLAQVIGAELELPVKKSLIRTISTDSQTKLGAAQRWNNVAGAFDTDPDIELPKRVLLVDDLLTTGATAHFAGQTLIKAGVGEVYVAVVGR